jgi:adenylate kinase
MPKNELSLIAFIGPEGSGKSTQARSLAKILGYPYVSTGDMLRDAAKYDLSQLGDLCRDMFEKHVYLSPQNMLAVVGDRLIKDDIIRGVILDGGFRTVEETEDFPEMLRTTGKDFALDIIFLRVPAWKCAERLMGKNGRKREDDTPYAYLKRMTEFNAGFVTRMAIIRNRWPLHIIDGNQSIENVSQEIYRRKFH